MPVATGGQPGLKNLLIRESHSRGKLLLIFVISEKMDYDFSEIAREICKNNPDVVGVCTNINPMKAGPVLGEKTKVIFGKGEIEDKIGP